MITGFGGQSPQVDAESWVAPNATVVGDVRVGADSSVWFGAVIRADSERITIERPEAVSTALGLTGVSARIHG